MFSDDRLANFAIGAVIACMAAPTILAALLDWI